MSREVTSADLEMETIGEGPPILFVHGSVVGVETWRHQRPLAERWTLLLPSRPGFGASPPLERLDFEAEAPLFAELLGDGAHLVGHSYGSVIALLAAAERPDAVRSLTVSEPGSLRVAAGAPGVDEMIANGELLFSNPERIPTDLFLRMFRSGAGSSHNTPDEFPEELSRGVELLKRERPSWEAEIPIPELRARPVPEARHLRRPLPGVRGRLRRPRRGYRRRARHGRRPRPHDPGDRRAVQRAAGALPGGRRVASCYC